MTDYIRDPHTDWGDLAAQKLDEHRSVLSEIIDDVAAAAYIPRGFIEDGEAFRKPAPCSGYEASDGRFERLCLRKLPAEGQE